MVYSGSRLLVNVYFVATSTLVGCESDSLRLERPNVRVRREWMLSPSIIAHRNERRQRG